MKLKEFLIYIKKLSFAKIINVFKYIFSLTISYISRNPVRYNYPLSISVEPINYCNLKCPQCPVGNGTMTRQKGKMGIVLFRKIIEQSGKYLLNLFLYFQGEPFLNKELFQMIEMAKNNNIVTVTSTNGQFLNEENVEKMILSGLDILIISLDGTTQEVYEQYRIGGDMQKVIDGIRYINKYKKKLGVKYPFVEIQFIVLKTNEHQIEDFKKLVKKLKVDKYSLKTAQIYDYKNEERFIPSINRYSRYVKKGGNWMMKKKIRNRCNRLWNSAVITVNGDVLPCCFDKNAKYSFGNIQEDSLENLVKGKKFQKFAKTILLNRSGIDICNNCTE